MFAFLRGKQDIQKSNTQGASESRSVMSDWNSFWEKIFVGLKTGSGKNITPETALNCSTVYACVHVLAETVASLPLFVYKRSGKNKDIDDQHPLYQILHDKPNDFQTSFEWREMLMGHACLRGNYFAYIARDGRKQVKYIQPLDPTAFQVSRDPKSKKVVYTYTVDGKPEVFSRDELVHVKDFTTTADGLLGLSRITLQREAIGLSLSAEEYGSKFFANDARPGGILKHPGTIKDDVAARLKKSWEDAHTKDNAHRVAVLEQGLEWQSIGLSNEDSQFLESRNFQVEEIARIFRVPSVLIGHPDKTMTYASAEQLFLSFVVHTIRPWLVRIEQVFNNYLFTEEERKTHFCEFQVNGLLRGDIQSRYEAYSIAISNRIMNPNECRELENMNPYPGGDSYENPNTTSGKPTDPKAPDKPQEGDDANKDQQ